MALLPGAVFLAGFALVMYACTLEGAGPLSAVGVLVGLCAIMTLVGISGVDGPAPEAKGQPE